MEKIIKRGDIYYANLNLVIGSEQGGIRPVLIISNDIGNKHSPTVIVAAIRRKRNCRHTRLSMILQGLIKTLLFCLNKSARLINNACESI